MTTRRSRSTTQVVQSQKEAKKLDRLMMQPAVHPIYEEAAQYSSNDVFWKSMLQFASRGKFPPNFFFRKNYICYKTPKNEILRLNVGQTPREVNTNFIRFVKESARVRSDIDILREKEEDYFAVNEIKSAKGVTESSLYTHFRMCRESWGVSYSAMASYEKLVFLLVRIYGKKIVDYDNEENVSKIKGIVFDEDGDQFVIDPVYMNRLKKSMSKNTTFLRKQKIDILKQKVDKESFEKTLLAIESSRKPIRMEEIIR